jgi:uncharacterized protein YjaZ
MLENLLPLSMHQLETMILEGIAKKFVMKRGGG